MGNHRKMIVFSFLIIMFLTFMTGCGENHIQGVKETCTKQIAINSIVKAERVTMVQDNPPGSILIPKNQETTLSEVTSWLQQAQQYKGKVPKSNISNKVKFNANIESSTLYIYTSDNHKISIQPAWYMDNMYHKYYVTDIIKINVDEQKIYIQSDKLYDWLKNDKWESEFKGY